MKLSPRTKKILILAAFLGVAVLLSGCAIPSEKVMVDGKEINRFILLGLPGNTLEGYTIRTSFSEVIQNENFFNAFLVWPLSWLINVLTPMLGKNVGVGLAIAIVTILVNGVLAVATMKSSIASQQMQLIQPEMERIQRKYEGRDDETSKMRQAAEMQALYKKYDINPGSVLLITFLQFPIIMSMYMSVQRAYAVQSGTFLGMNLQTTPLAGMQLLLKGDMSGISYLILFVVMGACQFLSVRLPMMIQKKKAEESNKGRKTSSKSSSQNQFMQYYMMIMILAFGLMWPAAMSLYWAINSVVNIVKTILVQKVIDKKQQA